MSIKPLHQVIAEADKGKVEAGPSDPILGLSTLTKDELLTLRQQMTDNMRDQKIDKQLGLNLLNMISEVLDKKDAEPRK